RVDAPVRSALCRLPVDVAAVAVLALVLVVRERACRADRALLVASVEVLHELHELGGHLDDVDVVVARTGLHELFLFELPGEQANLPVVADRRLVLIDPVHRPAASAVTSLTREAVARKRAR